MDVVDSRSARMLSSRVPFAVTTMLIREADWPVFMTKQCPNTDPPCNTRLCRTTSNGYTGLWPQQDKPSYCR